MATRFIIKNLCSIFYRQPPKKKKAHRFRTINRIFGDWATSAGEDVPPPYTDLPESKPLFQDEKHSPPPPFTSHRLQVCSHESLSFEELQKVVNSLAVSGSAPTINALTLDCHEHRSQIDPVAKDVKHVCTSSPGLLRGSGTYALEASKDPSQAQRVVLCFQWDLGFLDGIRSQVETAAEFQQFMAADAIWLCPHKQICDSDVVNAIYGFVKKPSGREIVTGCDRCVTEIKILMKMEGGDQMCHVTTKRWLGSVATSDDNMWLAQCGV